MLEELLKCVDTSDSEYADLKGETPLNTSFESLETRLRFVAQGSVRRYGRCRQLLQNSSVGDF